MRYKLQITIKTSKAKTSAINSFEKHEDKYNYTTKEINLVIKDLDNNSFRLFAINHSKSGGKKQRDFLVNREITRIFQDDFGGNIIGRTVLYKGNSKLSYQRDKGTGEKISDSVVYYNIEDFLYKLGENPEFILLDRSTELRL